MRCLNIVFCFALNHSVMISKKFYTTSLLSSSIIYIWKVNNRANILSLVTIYEKKFLYILSTKLFPYFIFFVCLRFTCIWPSRCTNIVVTLRDLAGPYLLISFYLLIWLISYLIQFCITFRPIAWIMSQVFIQLRNFPLVS